MEMNHSVVQKLLLNAVLRLSDLHHCTLILFDQHPNQGLYLSQVRISQHFSLDKRLINGIYLINYPLFLKKKKKKKNPV